MKNLNINSICTILIHVLGRGRERGRGRGRGRSIPLRGKGGKGGEGGKEGETEKQRALLRSDAGM